ncbi:MAG: sigma 54-interacting transcriptional regulator, partial [Myxococcota bacterium]
MSRGEGFETRVLEGTLDGAQVSLQVEVLSGPEKGQLHPVYSDRPFIIGTSAEASLVLTDDTVSRLHLELVRVGAKVRARDLKSTNGSFHQSAQFTELELPVGSIVRVGQTELRFLAKDDEASIPLSDENKFGDLLGRSIEMRKVFALLERASQTDATVLVTGETGTGKEVVAESLHKMSKRAEGPFVVVDCSAMPSQLIESELFGHLKGA